jgi:hypothetical protein
VLPHRAASLLIRSRHDDPAERRAHARGELVRVTPGRYVRSEDWAELSPEDRVVVRATAALDRLGRPAVLSHSAAAALWGMPLVGTPGPTTSVTDPGRGRTHTGAHVTKHAAPLTEGDWTTLEHVRLTTPGRTAVDVALTATRSQAVAALDHCLRTRLCTLDDYLAALDRRGRVRGRSRATWTGAFASPLAESAGESVLRVAVDGLGFPPPELQHPFRDHAGLVGHGDFWWEDAGVLDEFDGVKKYRAAEYRNGLSVEDVVVKEKLREDRLRALPEVRGVVRTVWRDLHRPAQLVAALERAGLRRERTGFRTLHRD